MSGSPRTGSCRQHQPVARAQAASSVPEGEKERGDWFKHLAAAWAYWGERTPGPPVRKASRCPKDSGQPFSFAPSVSVVQSLSCVRLCDPMNSSTPGSPVLHYLPEFAQTHVHCISDASNHLILCHPLLLLPSTFPSIRVFSNELVLHIR